MEGAIGLFAGRGAVFTLSLYLLEKGLPAENTPFSEMVSLLTSKADTHLVDWSDRELYRLRILQNAVQRDPVCASARVSAWTHEAGGLTACVFVVPQGDVYICFRGTGGGEWIDNGEGLSGVPEENTYKQYDENGRVTSVEVVAQDYASDQQVEALNWVRSIAARRLWNPFARVVVCGHSKGGNKAQFVAMHEGWVHSGISFDGQGFSPEALAAFRRQYPTEYDGRRKRLYSLSAANDYVNVLGERLVPPENVYYFEAYRGFHYLEAMLDVHGQFRPTTTQGRLSRYVESVSKKLMRMPPAVRQYATRGVMNVFQRHVGEGVPVNGDAVSLEETVAGIGIALGPLLRAAFDQSDEGE